MKGSSATSGRAAKPPPPRTARSSARHQPTLISVEEFALSGPSIRLDPEHNAYRTDLADLALAGRVIASHYAEPVARRVERGAALRSAPSESADVVRELGPGEGFLLLDDTLGWAWGYAGKDRRVGYVRSDVLTV